MRISSKSKFIILLFSEEEIVKILSLLSKAIATEARDIFPKFFEPLNIRSVPPLPRKDFIDCSPSTKRKDSTTLDFPEPFGPTIEVIGVSKDSVVFFANDLNPF